MVTAITQAVPAATTLSADQIPRRRTRILPVGRVLRQFTAPNPDELNSATEVYLQIGMDEGDDWLLLALLSQLLEQPFYGELRTKQQLGYIVRTLTRSRSGTFGLAMAVQSKKKDAREVGDRMLDFISSFHIFSA